MVQGALYRWDRRRRCRAPATALIASALACASAAQGLELDAPVSPPGVGMERGVVLVRCSRAAAQPRRLLIYYARGAIIDTGEAPAHEVILMAAHGLPQTAAAVRRECVIREGPRRSFAIRNAWFGRSTGASEQDWAVLVTARPFGTQARRLPVAELDTETLADLLGRAAPARLLLRRADAEQDGCRLTDVWLTPADIAAGLFLHSCRSWQGLSGSPIVMGMDGEPVLVGIHLGRARRPPTASGPAYLSFGRAIDGEIARAIVDAAASRRRGR